MNNAELSATAHALVAKSSAETPAKARWEVRSDAAPVPLLWQIRGSKLLAKEIM